jgi:hypothetical protein
MGKKRGQKAASAVIFPEEPKPTHKKKTTKKPKHIRSINDEILGRPRNDLVGPALYFNNLKILFNF